MPIPQITVIGAAIIDVLAGPVSSQVFQDGSLPMDMTRLSFGGDALNEAVVLSRLGKQVELISKVGQDEAGARVLDYIRNNRIPVDKIKTEQGLVTGMNIVLIDKAGERFFLTNPQSSLRKLSEEDIMSCLDNAADIVSFASMFVSPLLDIPAMERIFRKIKATPGRILAVDLTKAKNSETLEELKPVLSYIDYIFPNEEEISLLTGEKDVFKNSELLLDAGIHCAVIKRGSKGCLIRTKQQCLEIPAFPVAHTVDSTGAGDCFAAGFLYALSEKMTLGDCGRFACAAASCSVECVGAVDGIRSLDEVAKRFAAMKAADDRIKH